MLGLGSQLMRKMGKKINFRIPRRALPNICKAQRTDRSSWQSDIRQLSKLAIVRTYYFPVPWGTFCSSSTAYVVLTSWPTRNLWMKHQTSGCALLSAVWAAPPVTEQCLVPWSLFENQVWGVLFLPPPFSCCMEWVSPPNHHLPICKICGWYLSQRDVLQFCLWKPGDHIRQNCASYGVNANWYSLSVSDNRLGVFFLLS